MFSSLYRPIYILYLIVFLALGWEGVSFYNNFYSSYETMIHGSVSRNLAISEIVNVEAATYSDKPDLRLLFVGDVMLSRLVGSKIAAADNPNYPFLNVASTTQAADIFFGNLENPISARGENQGSVYSFRADPKVVSGLVFAGFDVVSVANNHTRDWGPEALADTIQLLKQSGIQPVGAGRNENEANAPVFLRKGNTTFAFLAYTNLMPKSFEALADQPGLSHFDIGKMQSAIRAAKKKASTVVVSLHWGEEYASKANDSQRGIARQLVDAGADLIIGHHPHVVQEVERYKKSWIAYSLGNFVFDQDFSSSTKEGLGLVANIHSGKISGVDKRRVFISANAQPQFRPVE